jgi:peptidoglycan/xylan/chitin deacetylase (PgdA/CDA1 family)
MLRKPINRPWRGRLGFVLLGVAGLACLAWRLRANPPVSIEQIFLLVPDQTDFKDPGVAVWLDAGTEEGLHVVALHDSDFLRGAMAGSPAVGVILPDTIHRMASDALVGGISRYVEQGGHLMLVEDAGIFNLNGVYPTAASRFSRLAGVDYAVYDKLRDKTIVWGQVSGDKQIFDQLDIPPGIAIPQSHFASDQGEAGKLGGGELGQYTLARYEDEYLGYPGLATEGNYDGEALLRSASGIAAGIRKAGKGQVLFVNLPLGYLKGQTDGLLLHGFLHYFAKSMLDLPSMEVVPNGVGGLVLNWHVDSNGALEPLEEMRRAGIFDQGPYSIHLTAGPDTRRIGDGLGLDVEANPETRKWILFFLERGNAVGNHGGWIHDYFGLGVREDNQEDFEKFLELNAEAIKKVTRAESTEYSAPMGNQPKWVTQWLQQHGVRAYYFTGNAGMGPTQTYRDGQKADTSGWSFPISHLGKDASLEEMRRDHVSDDQLLDWLDTLTGFCADHHTVRLFYSHPPGVIPYLHVLQKWLKTTEALSKQARFGWYTMTQMADFLNRRQEVQWRIMPSGDDKELFEARHPRSLSQMAWTFPVSVYAQPRILEGSGTVRQEHQNWVIVAEKGARLKAELRLTAERENASVRGSTH